VTEVPSRSSTTAIEHVWDRLNEGFREIYTQVLRRTATVDWLAEAHDNPSFPLMAYARFERKGRPDDEALVIQVDIHREKGVITWTTDACQERGAVLVDGPTRSAPATEPLASWVGEAADAAIAWLKAETPNFIAYLNQEPTPYDVD